MALSSTVVVLLSWMTCGDSLATAIQHQGREVFLKTGSPNPRTGAEHTRSNRKPGRPPSTRQSSHRKPVRHVALPNRGLPRNLRTHQQQTGDSRHRNRSPQPDLRLSSPNYEPSMHPANGAIGRLSVNRAQIGWMKELDARNLPERTGLRSKQTSPMRSAIPT